VKFGVKCELVSRDYIDDVSHSTDHLHLISWYCVYNLIQSPGFALEWLVTCALAVIVVGCLTS